ncbi:hypothetical protein [Puia dinghuensis]|uniref:Uncharacterized protein n=1 Tax=Puia dinghuensis TaxID=1792502 RepID=A0A8J2UI48_9BACT|nr:hypothetical protein [Puia dinghuensis]GGB19277.1 hypothetical protein GCM10011511_48690 [Puia dinghuensis]
MEFRTKIVIRRRNKRAYIAYAGLIIAASSLLVFFIPSSINEYYPYVFGAGIAVVIIGAVVARGDVRNYGFSADDLVVSTEGITVGAVHYPLRMVRNMNFNVEAYNGLYVNDGAMVSGSNSDGMTNDLSFESGSGKVSVGFYLDSKEHVQQLGLVFDAFYRAHLPFIERNRGRQTYLFQHLSGVALEEFKRKYGYA